MKAATFPDDESERLAALRALNLLDTPDEEQFDHLTRFVQAYFDVPVALISLVDKDRQWFKSKQGLSVCETERSISFCGHTITGDEAFVVENALKDERFADNPLVINEPHIRFYAGIPLHSEDGFKVGTLCIIDFKPREFSNLQRNKLRDFAQIVEAKIIQRTHELASQKAIDSGFLLRRWVSNMENRVNRKALAFGLAVIMFCVVATVVFSVDQQKLHTMQLAEQKTARIQMLRGVDEFEAILSIKLGLPQALAGLMYDNRDLSESAYLNFAQQLSASTKGISGLIITDGAQVTHRWYNMNAILNDEIIQLASQNLTVSNEVSLSGPYSVTTRGLYLIAQQRVLNASKNESRQQQRQAFSIINISSLLQEVLNSGLDKTMYFALAPSQSSALISFDNYSIPTTISQNGLSMPIHVGQSRWQFFTMPKAGWSNTYPQRFSYLMWGAMAGLLLASLCYYILLLPIRLRRILNLSNHRLQRSERRFRDALEALPEGIAIFDSSQKLAIYNDNFANMYAALSAQIECGQFYTGLRTAADDLALFMPSSNVFSGQFGQQRIIDRQLSDGRWIKMIECPMRDGGVVSFHCDITSMKKSEQLLVEQKQKAQIANEAKNHFLANMSHEVRTPLNGIVGLLDVLSEDESLTKQQHFYLNTIRHSSHDLMTILNDILDVSKIEAGTFTLHNQKFKLYEPCQNAVELLKNQAQKKGLEIVVEHQQSDDICVMGDQGRLQQIILNILNNAIKFTSEGVITVTTSHTKHSANKVAFEVSVKDTGIGIAHEQIPLLMTPFTQLNTGASRAHSGLGLGLAICKKLAQMMAGDIHIQSKLSQGTTVITKVLFDYADKPDHGLTDISQFQLTKPLNILIADDNEANHVVVLAMLSKSNISIDNVVDGHQAIKAAETKHYDLILMDIYMPDCDGVVAAQAIRAGCGININTPIIAFTANAMRGDKQRFINAGMDDYLAKPVTKQQLLSCIQKWI